MERKHLLIHRHGKINFKQPTLYIANSIWVTKHDNFLSGCCYSFSFLFLLLLFCFKFKFQFFRAFSDIIVKPNAISVVIAVPFQSLQFQINFSHNTNGIVFVWWQSSEWIRNEDLSVKVQNDFTYFMLSANAKLVRNGKFCFDIKILRFFGFNMQPLPFHFVFRNQICLVD